MPSGLGVCERLWLRDNPSRADSLRSDQEIFEGLNSLRSGESNASDVYAILSQLDDAPVKASEIVTAGWLQRLESLEDELMKIFPGVGKGKPDLSAHAEYVDKTDGLLVKSLELAEVLGRLTGRQ